MSMDTTIAPISYITIATIPQVSSDAMPYTIAQFSHVTAIRVGFDLPSLLFVLIEAEV